MEDFEEPVAFDASSEMNATAENEAMEALAANATADNLEEGTIQPGDTLAALLQEYVEPAEISAIAQECGKVVPVSNICVGHLYKIHTRNEVFDRFEYEINSESWLILRKTEEGYAAERYDLPFEKRIITVQGEINDNLFSAVSDQSEEPELAIRLAEIFTYDVDFVRALRQGDAFRVLIEKRYYEDQFKGYGRILAAEFVNQGKSFKGFLFNDKDGRALYYDENGRSLRKGFLKAPLDFSRVSSGFSMRRFHPVTHQWKAHPAIDYAAPVGTPVKAVGDGTVKYLGSKGAAGRMITVNHAMGYETNYLHLSRYAKGISRGSKIRQGQVIGYVGQSGMATGPHLDFRMRRNGSWVNPAKIIMPPAESIPQNRMREFRLAVNQLWAMLQGQGMMQATLPAQEDTREPHS